MALNLDRVREVEENAGTELSMKFSSPSTEFYDAWEGKLG